jgi:hypothetical protein
LAVGGIGCQSTPEPLPDDLDLQDKSDPQILYQATLTTFRESSMTVELASEKMMYVSTEFERVPDKQRLRRRMSARIVQLNKGSAALRLKTDFQRRFGNGEDATWRMIDSKPLQERAQQRELELGREIERRFHDWRERADK